MGKGGANEIGTCLFEFFKTQTAKKIIMYSDNCARQQKNKFVASLLLHTVNTSQYVEEILHKIFVVGHSQNEGDAMHALIEKKKKSFLRGDKLYLPSQLTTIISMAKQTHPRYKINQMCYSNFIDLKDLQSNTGRNFNVNTEGGKVLWSDICMLMCKKSTPTII